MKKKHQNIYKKSRFYNAVFTPRSVELELKLKLEKINQKIKFSFFNS